MVDVRIFSFCFVFMFGGRCKHISETTGKGIFERERLTIQKRKATKKEKVGGGRGRDLRGGIKWRPSTGEVAAALLNRMAY